MSILSNLLSKKEKTAPEVKRSRTAQLIAMQSMGQAVWSPNSIHTLSKVGFERNVVVYRCVRLIAEAASSVPCLLYDGKMELEEHPFLKLLTRPNPRQAGEALFEQVFGHLLISGNAYIEAVSIEGQVKELYALRPERMKLIAGEDGWAKAYEYTVGGNSVKFMQDGEGLPPILHLSLFHPSNDHYGHSPLMAAQVPIEIHNATSDWNKALLDNSARPSGALVYAPSGGQTLTDEQYERLKEELETSFTSSHNAGRPLLLEGGLDWKALSLSPKDMDFIEAKNAAAREIALAFGVPPMLLGIPGDNTYANYMEANKAFWRQTVLPMLGRTASALSQWLGAEWGEELRLTYDVDSIEALSADREALWKRVNDAGFLTDDEKRAAVGYGGEGKRFRRGLWQSAGLKFEEDKEYNPNQPREPAGTPIGGRWAGGGERTPTPRPETAPKPDAPVPTPKPRPAQEENPDVNVGRIIQDSSNNPSFPPKEMNISDKGTEFLAKYEQFRSKEYLDTGNHRTIGFGHLIKPGENFPKEGISIEEGLRIYKEDIAAHMLPVQRNINVNLTQNQFDALVSFSFNADVSGFSGSTMARLINTGNFNAAAQEFPKWVYETVDGEKILRRGLINRRRDELNIFLYGIYNIKK